MTSGDEAVAFLESLGILRTEITMPLCVVATHMLDAVAEYDNAIGPGCSDGFCFVTGKASGMHTNGGCTCWGDKIKAQRVMRAARRLRDALKPQSTE